MELTELDDLELPTAGDVEAGVEDMLAELESPASEPDPFDELDSILVEAKAERAEATATAEIRKKAKGGFGLTPEDQERIRRWELAKEWLPVSNTAIFKRYVCACGFHSTVFEGLMLEQRHRHSTHANRWTAAEASQANLPNNTAIRVKHIPMCQRCAEGKGFSLKTDVIWSV